MPSSTCVVPGEGEGVPVEGGACEALRGAHGGVLRVDVGYEVINHVGPQQPRAQPLVSAGGGGWFSLF